jgi:hypothetical protein
VACIASSTWAFVSFISVFYGIGARIDQQPDLLFGLHEVDEKELIAGAGKVFPLAKKAPAATKVLGGEDLSVLFGLDLAQGTGPDTGLSGATGAEPKRAKARAGEMAPAVPGGKGKVRAQGSASRRRKQSTASPGHAKPSLPAICPAVGGGSSLSAAFRISPFPAVSAFLR